MEISFLKLILKKIYHLYIYLIKVLLYDLKMIGSDQIIAIMQDGNV